ncbi:MAG: tetratricopeptide repeat protein, partial [Kangiellaceae bacterium]|nr:tetratricopeptide repeat protein [Kangiellaceae bacterium]
MQEISNELHYEYFVSGEIAKTENNTFLIKTILREVKTGKTVNANQVTSTDLFESIDEISSMIKIDLGIPDYHIETIRDLPVKELMSRDFSANRDFILGIKDMEQNNDYSAAAKNLAAAIKQDHSFALAHLYLGIVYANSSRSQESIASLKEALKFDYKMPDFFAFLTKDVFYVMRGEAKKRLKLLQMQAELYPEDIDSRIRLVLAYNNSNRFEDAIKEIKDIQKIASQPAVHMDDLAAIYVRIGDLPSALESYKNYANNFPQEAKSFNSLAYVYNLLGNESLARENYEKALFIESNNLTATLSLATLDLKLGQFEKATNAYLETLAQTYAPADRIRIFNAIASVKSIKGELQQALEFKEKVFEQLEIIRPPLSVTIQKLIDISIYMRAGKHEQALSILKQADATLKTPFEKLSSLGYVQYYLEIEDIEAATKQIQVVEQAAEQLDGAFSGLAYVPLIMRAAVEEL